MGFDVFDQVGAADPVKRGLDRPLLERPQNVGSEAIWLQQESDFWLPGPENPFDTDSLASARALLLVLALCVLTWGLVGFGVWLLL
jgi:hypothetical protein